MLSRAFASSAQRAVRTIRNVGGIEQAPMLVRLPVRPQPSTHLAQLQQRRCKVTTSEAIRNQYRKSPVMFPLAVLSILFSAGTLLVYAPYVYARYIVGEFHKFPEPVAKKLRRALYYTNHRLDPSEALKYYRQALEVADELGVDPFSDEMLGVKIQVSAFYEKIKNYDAAIKTLEVIRRDCLDWVDLLGDKHWNDGKRTRVLAKAVAISLKLGELYSNEYVQDKEAAEEQLVWAVETVLKEKQRRDKEGVKEGEGEWISNEEFGNALVSLAHNYEEQDKHYLATPLFLQALSILPPNTCHSVVLMNNIATSLAQQTPPPATLPPKPTSAPSPTTSSTRKSPPSKLSQKPTPASSTPSAPFPTAPAPPRPTLLAQSRLWAEKALAVAAAVPASQRTRECDVGCTVAAHNLGELAEMLGDAAGARRWYEEAREIARKVGFAEGLGNAEEGLRRVAGG